MIKNTKKLLFDHFITPQISSIHTEMITSRSVTHPSIALGQAHLTSSFYLHVLAPTPIIPYWFYYPFNTYKPYVC
jgi:hypothetical protein